MRKEELRHDPVRENIVKIATYFKNNQSTVFKIFLTLVILIAILSYSNNMKKIKGQVSNRTAGLAQNSFINNDVEAALAKFERIFDDYPGSLGATQSFVYLLKEASLNEDYNAMENITSEIFDNIDSIKDPVVKSFVCKVKGDLELGAGNIEEALLAYKQAKSISKDTAQQLKYEIDIVSVLYLKKEYQDAKTILINILSHDDLEANVKNKAEELLAIINHKLDT